ncbi:putative digalactosyldiacylglycerol synthase 1, chloroplastic [Sesbania bispinosa]|nr:putative digalactosyldiacylglycerol synthase 1, chloroplastic [Sesbania bispinosa]
MSLFYTCHYLSCGLLLEVPPLDVPELLAYFVRQSVPFLDQLGVKRDICDKIVKSLYRKRKNQLLLHSFSGEESPVLDNGNINDELDLRIASVLQSTGHQYDGGFWTDHAKHDLSDNKRQVAIVTTASLPWMTGTAVNPLFRAAYLSRSSKQKVTLLVPWLCTSDQELVYPGKLTFASPEEQEVYIRNWLEERIGFKADFKISFYPGKFSKERRSIIAAGDTSQFIPSRDADIAILEEPEHLNWYHHEYIKREKNGALQAFFVKHINNWVTRAYCHKVLRLSAATQDLPKSVICNVHGVNPKFLKIGEKIAADRELGQKAFTKGAYFLGKMVWAKGYKELIYLLAKHKSDLDGFKLDVFGNGEDANEVQSMAKRSFPNCLTYKTSEDFVAKLDRVVNKEKNSAKSSTDTGKLIANSLLMPNLTELLDGGLAFAHYCLTGNEFLRLCTGAIPGTRDYDKQHCEDLQLLPPQVENPIYGW